MGLSRGDSGRVCKTDLWALGSSLSSEDSGLDVLVVPELFLPCSVLLMESALQCLPHVWLMCVFARELNGLRFPKRFIHC